MWMDDQLKNKNKKSYLFKSLVAHARQTRSQSRKKLVFGACILLYLFTFHLAKNFNYVLLSGQLCRQGLNRLAPKNHKRNLSPAHPSLPPTPPLPSCCHSPQANTERREITTHKLHFKQFERRPILFIQLWTKDYKFHFPLVDRAQFGRRCHQSLGRRCRRCQRCCRCRRCTRNTTITSKFVFAVEPGMETAKKWKMIIFV